MKSLKPVWLFLLFALAVALPPVVLNNTPNKNLLVPGFWTMYFFISVLTLIIIVFMLTIQQINKEIYAQAFLGTTVFKLLACLVFVFVFVEKKNPVKVYFMLDFVYLYLLNTVFEICGLLSNLRNQN